MGVWIPQGEWAILGVGKQGDAHGRFAKGPRSCDRMGPFGKGSGTWESAHRGLIPSHEHYFQFGFGSTMRLFVKLLWLVLIVLEENCFDYWHQFFCRPVCPDHSLPVSKPTVTFHSTKETRSDPNEWLGAIVLQPQQDCWRCLVFIVKIYCKAIVRF